MTIKHRRAAVKLPRSIRKLFPKVTKAVDASVPVSIHVSKKDCTMADRMSPANCALARAAQRELQSDGAIIGLSSSYLIKGKTAYRFSTPASVQREIVSFDRHQDFAPGTYALVPKAPSLRFGKETRRGRTSPNKTVRRRVHHSVRVRVLPVGA